jgi:galactokinase
VALVVYNHTGHGTGELARGLARRARSALVERYGVEPAVISRAPGRLELLGAHTDYNDGFVCAIATDRSAVVAAAPRSDGLVRGFSEAYDEEALFETAELEAAAGGKWWDYLAGVVWALREQGCPVGGADLVVVSEVPVGGGVSSSAAVEVAYALALAAMADFDIEREELALLCQRAENEYVGMRCGILDQFTSLLGRQGHAMWLDCRTREHRLVPVRSGGVRFVVCDTRKPRELVESAYNQRRSECEEAARLLGVAALRDIDRATLEAKRELLPDTLLRRARHVVTENERVQEGVALLEAGDMAGLGEVLGRIHVSLRDDYEVSCPELEAMREAALGGPGCCGARMVGAGFGGCVIALVEAGAVEQFRQQVGQGYERATGLKPEIFATRPAEGAGLLSRLGERGS